MLEFLLKLQLVVLRSGMSTNVKSRLGKAISERSAVVRTRSITFEQ